MALNSITQGRLPIIDTERCVGSGTCSQIAPKVFQLDGGTSKVASERLHDDQFELVQNAIDCCPVQAISWNVLVADAEQAGQ